MVEDIEQERVADAVLMAQETGRSSRIDRESRSVMEGVVEFFVLANLSVLGLLMVLVSAEMVIE